MTQVLLTGATGYVGGRLLPRLLADGHEVRALSRNPDRATLPAEVEVVKGDPVSDEGLEEALAGADLAYYLIHSMGRGSGSASQFAERDRTAAGNFARAARRAGVGRIVYLGGLGGDGPQSSEHLRSRHEVAAILADEGPEQIYLRAAMVIGSGSASFEMLRHLVGRLPAMICPRWIDTRTQPIAIGDVEEVLALAARRPELAGEIQLGGAEVLTYRDMMNKTAMVLGRRAPMVLRVPMLTPRLSSHWVSLVTPVETGLVRPLIDGLGEEMLVSARPPAGINEEPLDFEAAVREAMSGRSARATASR